MGGKFAQSEPRTATTMLARSHRKLENRLGELKSALAAVRQTGDDQAIAVVDEVMSFLDESVVRHEKDEEESIFPLLAPEHYDLTTRLSREHRLQREMITLLKKVWRSGRPVQQRAEALQPLVAQLGSAYRAHIQLEDSELLPAIEILPEQVRGAIQREMRARRHH